jgi:IMP dehydrogenase/GMP reductase
VFLFFSVARSQEIGSWERATEVAPTSTTAVKPTVKPAANKTGINPNFGMNMPMMSSAFDTAMWLNAA